MSLVGQAVCRPANQPLARHQGRSAYFVFKFYLILLMRRRIETELVYVPKTVSSRLDCGSHALFPFHERAVSGLGIASVVIKPLVFQYLGFDHRGGRTAPRSLNGRAMPVPTVSSRRAWTRGPHKKKGAIEPIAPSTWSAMAGRAIMTHPVTRPAQFNSAQFRRRRAAVVAPKAAAAAPISSAMTTMNDVPAAAPAAASAVDFAVSTVLFLVWTNCALARVTCA